MSEIVALRFTPWYRWHPQLAIRYLPVVEFIRQQRQATSDKRQVILEVGSGGLGIAPYLRRPVTGVDIKFDPPIHPLLTPVVGDATKLPIKDCPFGRKDSPLNTACDIVVSMDMLEHLPKEKRERAISEMLRVTRRALVIGVPCGKSSVRQDETLRREYRTRHGRDFPFLREQVEYGLPEETDILGYIKTTSQFLNTKVGVSVIGNTNLNLRKLLMRGWMSNNLFVNLLFRKVFLLLVPLFRFLDRPPYYRKIFYVTVTRNKEQETRSKNL